MTDRTAYTSTVWIDGRPHSAPMRQVADGQWVSEHQPEPVGRHPMTDRKALIEAMARVIYDDLEGPVANQDFTRQMRQWEQAQKLATAALAAIEAMGAVVVPVEPTDGMIEAAHVAMFETPFTGGTMVMVGAGLDATLAASPYAKEPS